jgi:arylsulfatase A-like enzyme
LAQQSVTDAACPPWEEKPRTDDFAKDRWELYHVAEDFGQATDLATKYPKTRRSISPHAGGLVR